MELVLRVDKRGRLTLPKSVRKKLGTGRFVRLEVKEGKVELTPVQAPLEKLRGPLRTRSLARSWPRAYLSEKP